MIAATDQLRRVQQGLHLLDWKPPGPGVCEIRIHMAVEHRVLYVARFTEAVYVLHAFEKRTRKTARPDLELGRQRYRTLVAWQRIQKATER